MALINCKECGQMVSDAAKVCPHCGAPVIRDVFCPKCGTMVPENVRYCPACGNAISPLSTIQAKDKTIAGILTIVISLFSCYIWSVLMVVQGIMMLTMSEESFREKFVDTDKTFPLF